MRMRLKRGGSTWRRTSHACVRIFCTARGLEDVALAAARLAHHSEDEASPAPSPSKERASAERRSELCARPGTRPTRSPGPVHRPAAGGSTTPRHLVNTCTILWSAASVSACQHRHHDPERSTGVWHLCRSGRVRARADPRENDCWTLLGARPRSQGWPTLHHDTGQAPSRAGGLCGTPGLAISARSWASAPDALLASSAPKAICGHAELNGARLSRLRTSSALRDPQCGRVACQNRCGGPRVVPMRS